LCASNGAPYNSPCPIKRNHKYDNFCTHCFGHLFPNDPRTALIRKTVNERERRIQTLLSNNNIAFDWQPYVSFGCLDLAKQYAKTEFTLYSDCCTLVLEVDQHQHQESAYTVLCDMKRMVDVRAAMLAAGNAQPLLWVRYNPDTFYRTSQKVTLSQERREQQLLALLHAALQGQVLKAAFGIVYMYYNCDASGRPVILDDDDYHKDVAESFITAIND
jgi:hypothetical protein